MAIAAVGQLTSTASMAHNLAQCQILVQKAVAGRAEALFLPEATDYIAHSSEEAVRLVKSVQDSLFVRGLREEARKHKLAINVGVHEPGDDPAKVKNTLLWIDEQGEIAQRYQKLHLFDVDLDDGRQLRESKNTEAGDKILPPFATVIGKIGMTICFDLRFPEINLSLKRQGAEVIVFPSAFTIPTGKAHWEILLRARAIETQAYVIAAAQVGQHNEQRASYGHAMVVSPWGQVEAELKEDTGEPEIAIVDIDLANVAKIRKEMPLQRRTDVYPQL